MKCSHVQGVPDFTITEYAKKRRDYCICIPIINEGKRILAQLSHAKKHHISDIADIIICDGGSTDGSIDDKNMINYDVNTLLIKKGFGKQGSQLRMGFYFATQRNYKGVITIDGNNKDSIEDVSKFVAKLKEGYDFVQGSRFLEGGHAIRTPWIRLLAVRLIHAPVISLTARHWFTDTTNAFRGYSIKYLLNPQVDIFRDVFVGYELLAYLSVRATQIGLNSCEIPVTRAYPPKVKIPTKITPFYGDLELLIILFKNLVGKYNP